MDKVDMAVGVKIRLRRQQLALSQETVASALGLTFQQLQKYEKGVNRVSASRLFGLSRILDVSPGYFFEDDASAPAMEAVEDFLLHDRDCLRLNRAFLRIADPGLRRAIVALIQRIADEPADEIESGSIKPPRALGGRRAVTIRELQSEDR